VFPLSIATSLGAVVAVFKWGWAHKLIGASTPDPTRAVTLDARKAARIVTAAMIGPALAR
jgi:hypothetical protein